MAQVDFVTATPKEMVFDLTALIILLSFILLILILLLIDKISKRYDMSKRDIFMGLLTQVPILGGIVLFKKLVEIERLVKNGRGKNNSKS